MRSKNPDYNCCVSAPAGSGKTQILAERYIELLLRGISPKKILAITFTEKAAAEMKMRILKILKEEYPEIYKRFEEELFFMRVSTIHSFCYSLLKRFSLECGYPPFISVLSPVQDSLLFEDAFQDFLHRTVFKHPGHPFIKLGKFMNWQEIYFSIFEFFKRRPMSEPEIRKIVTYEKYIDKIKIFLENLEEKQKEILKKYIPEIEDVRKDALCVSETLKIWDFIKGEFNKKEKLEELEKILREIYHRALTRSILEVYYQVLDKYRENKKKNAGIDFSDMEILSLSLLEKSSEWSNILEIFDETTSHILIDEFQDTNFLQWKIITKLVEEWRSGYGAKWEKGEKTSLFIVGDEKQSIYLFRQANVSVFKKAKEDMKNWWKNNFYYENIKENKRSLKSIIDFNNAVFEKIMQGDEDTPWQVKYIPFEKKRKNENLGVVEIIILNKEGDRQKERKEKEADIIAKKIKSLIGKEIVFEKGTEIKRACAYKDIAILLRNRNYLFTFEESFRRHCIPYCVVGGIGFWQEPEIFLLRNFLLFLSRFSYNYGIYLFLKSPFCSKKEEEIFSLFFEKQNNKSPFLFDKIDEKIKEEIKVLRKRIFVRGVSKTLEQFILKKGFFRYTGGDEQKVKNIKKFLNIISSLEREGKTIFEIGDILHKMSRKGDEPKASVFAEGMNAVRILTIHKAKGLEFPVVIVPGIEDISQKQQDALVFEENEEGVEFLYATKDKGKFSLHSLYAKKLQEENKRIFYVALTRARDVLIISGYNDKKQDNGFYYIKEGLGLKEENGKYSTEKEIENLYIKTEEDIIREYSIFQEKKEEKEQRKMLLKEEIEFPEEEKEVKEKEVLGDTLHRIFFLVSEGSIENTLEIEKKADIILKTKGMLKEEREYFIEIIKKQVAILKEKGIWDRVIKKRENSFSEIEFVLYLNGKKIKGRIDRVIVQDDVVYLYDYKTHPDCTPLGIKKDLDKFSSQISIYSSFLKEKFKNKTIKSFIVFTSTGEIIEV